MTEKELVEKLIYIKNMADGKIATFSSQGQAMSGYCELAEYRGLLEHFQKVTDMIDNRTKATYETEAGAHLENWAKDQDDIK